MRPNLLLSEGLGRDDGLSWLEGESYMVWSTRSTLEFEFDRSLIDDTLLSSGVSLISEFLDNWGNLLLYIRSLYGLKESGGAYLSDLV